MSSVRGAAGIVVLLVPGLCVSVSADTPQFLRGDVNMSGTREITDAVVIFNYLFLSSPRRLPCDDAADVDDHGIINLTDGIFVLNHLFLGGPRPPPPYDVCGPDPSGGDLLGCDRFDPCGGGPPRPCGGIGGVPCDAGEFCEFPPGTCDVADNAGECMPIPEFCPEDVFDPVCGCDGVTYPNDCERRRAGAQKASDGPCGAPKSCGGIVGFPCDRGEFCEFPPGTCDVADNAGECVPIPEACPAIFDPVCGCDGQTYSSDCARRAAQVQKAHDGECGQPPKFCGGIAGFPCDEGEFCEFPPGTCDVADNAGECVPIPKACPPIFDPVCGCDGRTYPSDCDRRAAQVQKAHDGECGMGGKPCDGFAGTPCAEGEFCEHAPGACDIAVDGQGTCTPIPTACPDVFDPVCGCDGQTYGNDCERQMAKASKLHDGPCEGAER